MAAMFRFLQWMTGAQPGNIARTLYSFSALFFLLVSYYLIKPLRNSQFLKEFDPNLLPFFFLIMPLLSLALTKVFNYFYDRMSKRKLVIWTFGMIVACKGLFLIGLFRGGPVVIVAFYFWASVYFLLAIAVLWGCINDIFTSEQGERSFGFIALGGTLGNILGAEISSVIARSQVLKDYALAVAAAAMLLAMGLLLQAMRLRPPPLPSQHKPMTAELVAAPELLAAPKQHFFSDLSKIFANRYVRAIAVMVFTLGIFNTTLEFQGQKLIDRRLSEQQYLATFATFNQGLNLRLNQPSEGLNSDGFALIYGLKSASETERKQALEQFLHTHPVANSTPASLMAAYPAYRNGLESRTRELFSNVYKYQGLLGIVLLLGVSRWLFRSVGVRFAAAILPAAFLLIGAALFFPLELMLLEVFLIVGGALNYSLNNATKELLYTSTSEETKFKQKPLIEGPIMRLGDVLASLLKLGVGLVVVTWMHGSEHLADGIMLGGVLLLVLYWLWEIWYAGSVYDHLKQTRTPDP
jgi:ATP/ADP translocase